MGEEETGPGPDPGRTGGAERRSSSSAGPADGSEHASGMGSPEKEGRGVPGALRRYRVMAWLVGVLLLVLTVGVFLRYGPPDNPWVSENVGVLHGWLYLVLLITAFDLGRRVRWPWWRLLLIAAAGTVPFLSFVAEHYATRDVRQRVTERPGAGPDRVQ